MNVQDKKKLAAVWNMYSPKQQADILTEFALKMPNDYYCKENLFNFLSRKIKISNGQKRSK